MMNSMLCLFDLSGGTAVCGFDHLCVISLDKFELHLSCVLFCGLEFSWFLCVSWFHNLTCQNLVYLCLVLP